MDRPMRSEHSPEISARKIPRAMSFTSDAGFAPKGDRSETRENLNRRAIRWLQFWRAPPSWPPVAHASFSLSSARERADSVAQARERASVTLPEHKRRSGVDSRRRARRWRAPPPWMDLQRMFKSRGWQRAAVA